MHPSIYLSIYTNALYNISFAGQQPNDRPDIISRVFQLKKEALLNMLIKEGVLGRPIAHVHVIEFQKRGLPHMHLLIIFHTDDKLRTTDDYDACVSAEIPDKETEPKLYELVQKHMMHGPCGELHPTSPCMKDGHCSKHYPKNFGNFTSDSDDGYPKYKRRENNRTVRKTITENNMQRTLNLDNRWVVPYNKALLLTFETHINVEVCASINAVKYLYLYIYKGHDRADIELREKNTRTHDEITHYMDTRYISASEASWRIFNLRLHETEPHVERLAVHLEGGQRVVFQQHDIIQDVLEQGPPKSTLRAWLELNKTDSEAQQLRYFDIPKHYVYNKQNGAWHKRRGLGPSRAQLPPIGRMYFVHPMAGERFYLRLILTHAKGATSFEDLRTVPTNNTAPSTSSAPSRHVCKTYKEAAEALGLLEDDTEYRIAFQEAANFKTPHPLRNFFVGLLTHASLTHPKDLWEEFKMDMCSDHLHEIALERNLPQDQLPEYDIKRAVNKTLHEIQHDLEHHNRTLAEFGIETPSITCDDRLQSALDEHRSPNPEKSAASAQEAKANMTDEQKSFFEAVLTATQQTNSASHLFFLDAPGGCGKTFTLNALIDAVQGQGNVVLPVATSGIAAQLLTGGTTAHSTFKFPLHIDPHSNTSTISVQEIRAKLIRHSKLIIWDEAPMAHKHLLQLLDTTLRDIMSTPDTPFGGKVVVLSGDFIQILPVIVKGSRAIIVNACLKKSHLWQYAQVFHLTKNMRVHRLQHDLAPEALDDLTWFAKHLLEIGESKLEHPDIYDIPERWNLQNPSLDNLISQVYGNLSQNTDTWTTEHLTNRCILCPTNKMVHQLNEEIMQEFKASEPDTPTKTYHSIDEATMQDSLLYPTEFLNMLDPVGLPPHRLTLKVGSPIILLRNLNTRKGLVNGTRLIVTHLLERIVIGKIITGSHAGQTAFIPRIPLDTEADIQTTISFRRRQLPIKPAFAITINKGQGQTFKHIGIYLPTPCFSHGQLYVAMSRVGSPNGLTFCIPNNRNSRDTVTQTNNVVYNEVL